MKKNTASFTYSIRLVILLSMVFSLGYTQNLPVKYFDIKDGLSNYSVNTIFQDSTGFLWFGTYDGLNRYDGYEFKIYRNIIGDATSINNNNIKCIEEDTDGNIWVGNINGISILNKKNDSFQPLLYQPGKKSTYIPLSDFIYSIVRLNKLILAGTQNNGLIIVENNSNKGKKIPLQYSTTEKYDYCVSAIEKSEQKNFCWVFVNDVGLCKFNITNKKLQIVNRQLKQANCMLSCPEGLWIGSNNGLYLLKNNKLSESYLPSLIINKLLKDKKSKLWIASDGAGTLFMDKGKIMPALNKYGKLITKSKAIIDIFEDKDRNIWIGTLRGGISMLVKEATFFNHILYQDNSNEDPTNNFILSFCEDQKKNLWIGTDGAGLRYWDRKNNKYQNYTSKSGTNLRLSNDYITSITTDKEQNVWVGTWGGGINKIDPKNATIKHYNCYNPITKNNENFVWLVFPDSNKNLWASTLNSGHLYKYNSLKNNFELYYKKPLELLCIAEAKDGTFWAGSYSNLLHIDPKTAHVVKIKTGYTIRCVHPKNNNQIWIGTADGGLLLYNIKNKSFRQFTTKHGLPSNTILRIIEGKDHNLWLSTYNGLSCFNPNKNTFTNYTVADGLQSNQFSYNAGILLSSGEIAFGGINGFNIFSPENIKNIPINNNIAISNIFINNKLTKDNKTYTTSQNSKKIQQINLPYDSNNISIDFVCLDFKNSDKIKYAYYLEGWDKEWISYGKSHKANYMRLTEGTYTFKVKTSSPEGKWSKETELLTVVVYPPWYRTIWAYGFYLIIFTGLIYGYIRYNNNKQRLNYEVQLAKLESKKEKELSEKQLATFGYMSHEFRTPISLIINPIKESMQKEEQGLPHSSLLNVAYRNARRLLSLVDQLLLFQEAEGKIDNIKIASFSVQVLCMEVYKCFEYQAKVKEIIFDIEIPKKPIMIFGDYEKLEIALFNLLSNAFKFTPEKGRIVIKVDQTQDDVYININDSGIGIEEEKIDHIFDKFYRIPSQSKSNIGFGVGLYIVKQFIEKHHGAISCISTKGTGTTFKITLKKGNEHFPNLPLEIENASSSGLMKEMISDELLTLSEVDNDSLVNKEFVSNKKSIVIVEDDEEMTKYLISLFSSNYIIYSASNGVEGFDLIQKIMPDIVISDINMEHMNGLDLCKTIKQTTELSHIPVILLTATTNADSHLLGINSGADDYVTKPFDHEILIAKVNTLIKNRNQLRKYFLDSITLKENSQKVPLEYTNFLNRCIEIIEKNIDREDFTIKEFSIEIGMSHSSLYKKIKLISGQTINAFIRSVRLRRAAVLLLTENLTISEAGSKVGIGDPRYFRRQFGLLFNMSPSEYIKKYRNSFNKELNIIQQN